LLQGSDANTIGGSIVAGRRTPDVRATMIAEMQGSGRSALRCLFVFPGRSFEESEFLGGDHDARPKGATGEGLAIRTVADSDAFRVDVGFEPNCAAMALAFD